LITILERGESGMGNKNMTQEERIRHYANLIQRQTGKAVRPYRADGYVNMMTRYGTSKDSSEHYKFVPEDAVPDELLTMHYESNGLFAKIIDTPAEEAIKHGFKLDGVSDQAVEDFFMEALDELDWEETAMTAIKWARLFGGSIAIMLINDGRGLEEPLDWKNIQSIDDIRVYDRSLIQPDYNSMFSYNPVDPFRTRGSRLGTPEYYQVFSKYGSFVVHDSRCLVFRNGILPENTTNSVYQLWGIPEYIRINKAIQDAEVAHRSAPKLLDRSVQPVYKMKDLSAELATEEGEDRVLKRLQIIDMARGLLNSLVIDSEGEEYDFKTFQFSGVNDVVSSSCNMLSAITNIPQTILFGQAVGGLSTTDDTSMENYYNYIERIQKRMLKSNLRYLLSVIFQAGLATGEIDEIPKLKVKFNPLWSMSDTEQADLELKKAQIQQTKAQTAQIYVSMEAIDPSEVRKKLADSEEFDVENMLDEYDEEDLFAEFEDQMGQETVLGTEGKIPQDGDLAEHGQNAGTEAHNINPVDGGNAPATAPAATKLPQDMSAEEKAKAEEVERGDGGQAHRMPIVALKEFEDYFRTHEFINSDGTPIDDTGQITMNAASAPFDSLSNAEDSVMPNKETQSRQSDSPPDAENSNGLEAQNPLSVGVIVVSDGRILCGIRNHTKHPGLVCGPGGHIEAGETAEQAAYRETEEEFGIRPKELIPLGFGPNEPDTGLTPYLFLCTEYEGEPNCADMEMTNPAFRTMEELDDMATAMFQPFRDGIDTLLLTLENAESSASNTIEQHFSRDGGVGSGNFGHEGRPGKTGGSAPGNQGRPKSEGKDISGSYKGKRDIKSVIKAQGFDGLPRIVTKDEFDEAVKASSFVAQRTYTASSPEVLNAYRNMLYNGNWYVDCEVGGAQYGQGMYCAADWSGKISDGIKAEMAHYRALGEERALNEASLGFVAGLKKEDFTKSSYCRNLDLTEQEVKVFTKLKSDPSLTGYKLPEEEKKVWEEMVESKKMEPMNLAVDDLTSDFEKTYTPPSFTETLTIDPSAKVVKYEEITKMQQREGKDYLDRKLSDYAGSKGEECKAFFRIQTGADLQPDDLRVVMKWQKEKPDEFDRAETFRIEATKKSQDIATEALRMDVGAYAAMKGYDAINAEGHGESASYTVILNRTKVILLDGDEREDGKGDSIIKFEAGNSGVMYAIRGGKVIGWVKASDGAKED